MDVVQPGAAGYHCHSAGLASTASLKLVDV